jgi:hypothetical protein
MITREWLDSKIPVKWIGQRRPVECLPLNPRSPDLAPLDIFLWGHLKSVVYTDCPRTTEALKTRIQEEYNKISVATPRAVTEVQNTEFITAWHSTDKQSEHLLE